MPGHSIDSGPIDTVAVVRAVIVVVMVVGVMRVGTYVGHHALCTVTFLVHAGHYLGNGSKGFVCWLFGDDFGGGRRSIVGMLRMVWMITGNLERVEQ